MDLTSASCPLFVELCAGTAALSLRLQGGNRCRPVVSRMGAKTGYANVILSCFGLTPGGKAGAYLWCEPDPGARLLLQALPQPEVLREAASVLRGWASEDPRTLWEALRKEGPPKSCDGREVARHAVLWGCSFRQRGPDAGIDLHKMLGAPATDTFGAIVPMREVMADRCASIPPWPPVAVTSDAREIGPPRLPEGTVAFMDPPYEATTGYGHDLPRSDVVRMARLWANAGAFVGVSEQVPIPELMADGWHAVQITNGRKGAARTFSRQKSEWLTLSRPPVNPPLLGVQEGLWT